MCGLLITRAASGRLDLAPDGGLVVMIGLVGFIRRLLTREEGQTLTEYGLILFFIAVIAIAAVTLLGERISGMFDDIRTALS